MGNGFVIAGVTREFDLPLLLRIEQRIPRFPFFQRRQIARMQQHHINGIRAEISQPPGPPSPQ